VCADQTNAFSLDTSFAAIAAIDSRCTADYIAIPGNHIAVYCMGRRLHSISVQILFFCMFLQILLKKNKKMLLPTGVSKSAINIEQL
jgi:hypothetical protein